MVPERKVQGERVGSKEHLLSIRMKRYSEVKVINPLWFWVVATDEELVGRRGVVMRQWKCEVRDS